LGLAFTLHRPAVAALALLPLITFALVDAQYLRIERRFRGLFDSVRMESWDAMPTFEINLDRAPAISYWSALRSWSITSFYVPLALAVVIAVIGAGLAYGE
jgi:histidine triad (HIT) family protein